MGITVLSLSRLCDCPSVCLSLCLSVCLSSYLSVFLSVFLSVCLSQSVSVCLYVPLFLQCRQLSSQGVIPTTTVLCRHEHAVAWGAPAQACLISNFVVLPYKDALQNGDNTKNDASLHALLIFFLVHSSFLKVKHSQKFNHTTYEQETTNPSPSERAYVVQVPLPC